MAPEASITNPARTISGFRRVILFTLLCLISGAGVVAYALHSRQRMPTQETAGTETISAGDEKLSELRRHPHLLFRNTTLGPAHGRVSLVRLEALDGPRVVTELSCERVYSSAGAGLCLQASRGVFTMYRAVMFGPDCKVVHSFSLAGTPSRTRVSRDGKMAATTVFVKGDSYNSGGFSTRTTLIDLGEQRAIADLEEFTVTKDGQPFRKADFNFWGVTFAPDNRQFFATLSSGGIPYLVEGNTDGRHLTVRREGVECPSISPDGSHLAFKSRTVIGGRAIWRLHVLNLASGSEIAVNEGRSVDDQAEWLDASHVLYSLPRSEAGSVASDIWIARADGMGTPTVFVRNAMSPCVVRP